jgi:predicted RNase H-like nuclease (RuvC/YqgF family)
MESSGEIYFGIDVARPGSKLSDFVFSVAVMRGENVVKVDDVSASRLIRMLWELRPVALAVDNILELGGSVRNLLKFLSLFPPGTKIVQVNLDEKGLRDLRTVAKSAGIEIPHGKLDSKLSALVIATLASKGFGREVEVFSRKVKVYVYGGRSGRSGGSSAGRFKRGIRAVVAQTVRKIEEALRSESIEYDVSLRRSKGGVESAVFTVYCSRERLHGVIKKVRGHDVVVRIKPVINISPLKQLILPREYGTRYLIVGLDPGIEVGIAVLDLDGRVLLVRSGKGLDRDDVVSLLRGLGRVVLVATDKHQLSEFVKKVAAALGAKVYTPDRDFKVYEKESMVSAYTSFNNVEIKDTHARDALAAALAAFRSIENKIKELEDKLSEMGLDKKSIDMDKYKIKIIEGQPIASILEEVIAEALSTTESEGRVTEIVREAKALIEVNESMKRRIKELEGLVEALEAEKRQLLSRIKTLEEDLSRLRSLVETELASISRSVMKDRKVYELAQRLVNTTKSLDELRREYDIIKEHYNKLVWLLAGVAKGELVVLRRVPSIEHLTNLLDKVKQEDVVFVDNLSIDHVDKVVDVLKKYKLGLVVPDTFPEDQLEKLVNEAAIPVVKGMDLGMLGDVAIVNHEVMNRARETMRVVDEIRRSRELSRKGLTLEEIETIIREYRKFRENSPEAPV